ncbi:amidohydrolase [Comamonas terrae]|uniref:Amidohydrolase n=1 Tax=Comamonas terrae TaxID=673548 RepID=A0ABW5UNP2_9BURK|nr:amidohydrolase [Comamonas terrae]
MHKRQFLMTVAASGASRAALPVSALLGACATGAGNGTADAIYFGGPILTMNDAQPQVEAVAVAGGVIRAVGRREAVFGLRGPATRMVDLQGRTLIPGFVDPHSHLGGVGLQAISANLLPPPDGDNSSIAGLQQTFRRYLRESKEPAQLGMVFGFGYDDSQLEERRHPTREDLDQVSMQLPVVAIHQSGHFGALNSVALARAGITAGTPDPEGGVIRRQAGSREPDGVLEENAFFRTLGRLMPRLTTEQAVGWLEQAQQLYLQYGYTTVQDGRADPQAVATAIAAAERGRLLVDVVSYPDILQLGEGAFMTGAYYGRTYKNRLRIGGVKLTLDGSPQGKTAWLTQPYRVPPAGQPPGYKGYGVLSDAQAHAAVARAVEHGWQILVHANGDAAIDQFIGAVRAAGPQVRARDMRPVLIHGQTLRRDQVSMLKELGIFPSLFPMHTFYWGDWHRDSVLGDPRAQNISPTGWVLEAGLRFTSHHDAPVALPSSIRVLDATVNRTTRSGRVLGPEHRVSPWTALQAQTLWSAYQHFEEDRKGSIEPGKLADLVVLSDNPMTVERHKLASIQVLETIKQGRSVYRANA